MKMAVFIKENAFCVDDFAISYLKIDHWSILGRGNEHVGAILMKMAVFSKENAFCVNHFSISYLKLDHWSI